MAALVVGQLVTCAPHDCGARAPLRASRLEGPRNRPSDLDAVTALIEAGAVKRAIEATYELAEIAEAIRHLAEEHARAKVVIAARDRHAALQPSTKETEHV